MALPLLLSAGNVSYGVAESSQTRFCLSCHEMQRHGQSLFVDSRQALAAVHYQNRLVERDSTCYSCHKDYALFGDVKAKLNGLRHVWAHYVRGVPERLALYQPYPNANCLYCHDDAGVGGVGKDYYHFGSYFQLRYYPTDWLFAQYRQGLRTFGNRRGTILDNSRLTSADGSTHNFDYMVQLLYDGISDLGGNVANLNRPIP